MDEKDAAPPAAERRRLSASGLLVNTVKELPGLFVPILAGLYGTRNSDIGALPLIAGVLVLGVGWHALVWLRHFYTVSDDDIRIEKGLINRTTRSIPFERIVDVTIERPALARVMGLAVVRFDTGGGESDEAALRYVTQAEAERLRQTVRSHRTGAPSAEHDPAEAEPPSTVLFAMDPRRIVTLGLYSFSLVIFGVLIGLSAKFDFLMPDWPLWLELLEARGEEASHLSLAQQGLGLIAALAALIAIGIGTGIVRVALREWGFVLERTPKGLRRRRGLLTHTDMTVSLPRVQLAEIGTGAIRARRGWHWLTLASLAGAGGEDGGGVVAPLARLEEIWPILREAGLTPPADETVFARPVFAPVRDWIVLRSLALGALGLAAHGLGLPYAWLVAVPMAWLALRDWLRWRRKSGAVDSDQLYLKAGWWTRLLVIARQINVQSVSVSSSPLERRHGLARVDFGIPNGAMHLGPMPLAEALAIRDSVLAIAAPVDFSRLNRPH